MGVQLIIFLFLKNKLWLLISIASLRHLCKVSGTYFYREMDHVKQKGVFEHAQNDKVLFFLSHVQSLIWAFALHWYII